MNLVLLTTARDRCSAAGYCYLMHQISQWTRGNILRSIADDNTSYFCDRSEYSSSHSFIVIVLLGLSGLGSDINSKWKLQSKQLSSQKLITCERPRRRQGEHRSSLQPKTEHSTPCKNRSNLPEQQLNLSIPSTKRHNQNTTMLGAIAGLQPRQLAAQVLNFALVLSTAFMLWKGLSVATDSSSPIVVVLSGSMEPAFQRGDLLFLWNRGVETQVGEVVVYNVRGKDIPIVHRVIRKYGGG
jgi:hypothetical protein